MCVRRVEYDLRGVLEGSLYKVVQERGDCDTTPRSIEKKILREKKKKKFFGMVVCGNSNKICTMAWVLKHEKSMWVHFFIPLQWI